MSKNETTIFLAAIMIAVGIVGFLASLSWGRVMGRNMDRDTVLFLAKIWGAIVLLFLVFDFTR
jgi:predicted MFS family arabinose efflux permease